MTTSAVDAPRRRALITGASGGIGLELADLLAARGFDLLLVARSADRLAESAERLRHAHGVRVDVLPADGAAPGAAAELWQQLVDRGLDAGLHVLVNNAGFGGLAPFETQDPDEIDAMIRLNVGFLTALTRSALPALRATGRGRVLQVASTAAFQPGPWMAVYYATKAYVLSFGEALAQELRGSGVQVTTLCPGPTVTGFQERARMQDSAVFSGPLLMSARRVAELGVRGLFRGRRVVITGWINRLAAWAVKLAPRRLVTAVVARLQAGRRGAH